MSLTSACRVDPSRDIDNNQPESASLLKSRSSSTDDLASSNPPLKKRKKEAEQEKSPLTPPRPPLPPSSFPSPSSAFSAPLPVTPKTFTSSLEHLAQASLLHEKTQGSLGESKASVDLTASLPYEWAAQIVYSGSYCSLVLEAFGFRSYPPLVNLPYFLRIYTFERGMKRLGRQIPVSPVSHCKLTVPIPREYHGETIEVVCQHFILFAFNISAFNLFFFSLFLLLSLKIVLMNCYYQEVMSSLTSVPRSSSWWLFFPFSVFSLSISFSLVIWLFNFDCTTEIKKKKKNAINEHWIYPVQLAFIIQPRVQSNVSIISFFFFQSFFDTLKKETKKSGRMEVP